VLSTGGCAIQIKLQSELEKKACRDYAVFDERSAMRKNRDKYKQRLWRELTFLNPGHHWPDPSKID